MASKILTSRELNRALFERQLLAHRVELSAVEAVGHLVGMQSQAPNAPYLGLWSRLSGFTTGELVDAMTARRVVRVSLMRGTIHLVTAADAPILSSLMRPLFLRLMLNPALDELEPVLAVGRKHLDEQPRTLAELRELMGEEPARMSRFLLPLVHVPPRGLWGRSGQARLTTLGAWLDAEPDQNARLEDLVLRYLAAFGPASVKDMQTWCGLTGLREVFRGLELRRFRDESGAELFDLPDAPLPDPDVPAPVRLLPEYDNCLRSHADRRRVMTDDNRAALFATKNDAPMPAFLIDGFVRGTWKLDRSRTAATVLIRPFGKLSKKDFSAVSAEAARLLDFAAPGTDHDVRVDPA
jgi:hypothetical protein